MIKRTSGSFASKLISMIGIDFNDRIRTHLHFRAKRDGFLLGNGDRFAEHVFSENLRGAVHAQQTSSSPQSLAIVMAKRSALIDWGEPSTGTMMELIRHLPVQTKYDQID